jgi:hypothetical protein
VMRLDLFFQAAIMYRITYKDATVKEYPYKLQCYVWLITHGHVSCCGRGWYGLRDNNFKIVKVRNDKH